MALDEPQGNDEIKEINGIKVAIDSMVKDQTEGIELDVEERDGQKGIVLNGISDCC
ncbi:hypothetical protein RZN22_16765 [Bacillaceae bacterium S4-13-58]